MKAVKECSSPDDEGGEGVGLWARFCDFFPLKCFLLLYKPKPPFFSWAAHFPEPRPKKFSTSPSASRIRRAVTRNVLTVGV